MEAAQKNNAPKPNGRRPAKYPFNEMQVGESFLFDISLGRNAYSYALQASKNGKRFKAHKTAQGWRCWRVI